MASQLWIPSRRMVLAGAAGLGIAPSAFADAPALVRAIEVASGGEGRAALNIALSRPISPRTFFLGGPARFVVDLPDTRFAGAATGQGPGGAFIRGYRYALRADGARVVLDLDGPASLESLETGGARSPGLHVELASSSVAAAAPVPGVPRDGRRRIIVIDAGHGGRDPGAIGVTGVREKDVVLDAAIQLRDALEVRGRYRVALTRDADTFIPLQERVNFARGQGAELFISLHADAAANHDAAGASVYTLSDRGSNRARNIMDNQNWIIDTGDAPRNGVVGDILVDLAQRETTNRSAVFAQTAIRELQEVSPLLANTHRSAGFFVLLAPDVPAVLIEMGFLTNAADERRLATQRERQRMAEKLADAVDHYFAPSRTYMARA